MVLLVLNNMIVSVSFFVLYVNCAPVVDKVLVLGLDGFGGQYVKNATKFAPYLHELFEHSLVSFNMRAQFPAVSAPNWAALFTGMSATETGIMDNGWDHTETTHPVCPISGCDHHLETFFDVAKTQNPDVSGFNVSAWEWIEGFALNRSFIENPKCLEDDDACVEKHILGALTRHTPPKLVYAVFEAIDHAGHSTFWGSPEYYAAVTETDERVKRILAHVDHQTLVVMTADHGGFRDGHGDFDKFNLESFVAYYVKDSVNLLKGELELAGSNVKVAPTILTALGLSPGRYMSAEPLRLFGEIDRR